MTLTDLRECLTNSWSPTIGDPSLIGWATVAAYGVAALLCAAAFYGHRDRRLRVFGAGLTLLLLALMVNKQLDLQSALTAAGRCLSQLQGWYEDRRVVQALFILGLLLFCLCFGILVTWAMRRRMGQIWLMLLGLILLLAFIAIRAVGFHHFDALINLRIGNVRVNWILELGGLAMIAVNALWLLGARRSESGR